MGQEFFIEQTDVPIPPIKRSPGRPKGSGCNMRLLKRMKPGNSIFDVPKLKMLAFCESARMCGVKVKVRKLPYGNELYAIWRIE